MVAGKKALVVGAGSDIGKAIAITLRSEYDVLGTYHQSRGPAEAAAAKAIRCDIRELQHIDEVLHEAGTIDLLVTSAFPFLESGNLDFEGYLKAESFLRGHIYLITQAAKQMNDGGKIVNILGQAVERGLPGAAFYAAAFAFLHNWSNSINAVEGKANKISACDLLLGPVDTREWHGLSEEILQRYKAKVADFIKPEQVGETVRFLTEQPIMPSTFKLDAYCGY